MIANLTSLPFTKVTNIASSQAVFVGKELLAFGRKTKGERQDLSRKLSTIFEEYQFPKPEKFTIIQEQDKEMEDSQRDTQNTSAMASIAEKPEKNEDDFEVLTVDF